MTSSSHQAGLPDVPSPAFLASVISAVKQALVAEQHANSAQASCSTNTSMPGATGGFPTRFVPSQQTLQGQASAFAASSVGFSAVPASIAESVASSQGRPNFIVPSYSHGKFVLFSNVNTEPTLI